MKIAHLTATFPPNWTGAGNTCLNFARRQAASGHRVEVFTADAPGERPDAGGAVVHRYRPRVEIGNAPLIPAIAGLRGFDVVHLHYPFIFGVELLLAGRLRGRDGALVVSYKNELVGDGVRRPLFWAYEHVHPGPRRLIAEADRVCILSRDHAGSVGYLRSALRREPEKLVEMPNGVETEAFTPGPDAAGVRARHGIPEDAVLAVFVATLDRAHHFKRLDLAIEALAALGPGGPHLLVAGGGELLESYRRLAAERLGDRAHLIGAVDHDELPDVLRAGDFLLLTTEPPESFGIVLIEAMACGLPVVATDYPGVAAVVDDGETGMLVPRGDVEAARSAIERMVDMGAERRRAMGAAARRKAEQTWAWPRLVERMEGVYCDAIEHRAGR
jgi:glycosyltransferase involved in cell wall biosynthesis